MSNCALKNTPGPESTLFQPDTVWEHGAGYGDFLLLHSGEYADTYRAGKAGQWFLLKTPKSGNTAYLNILRREYELSAGLDHPNIISAFTFEDIPPLGPCLVMKYVDGVSLDEYLSGNPGTKSKKRILSQLLSAVGYLHRCGIVHNDLKPANIIILASKGGGEDNLKLIDFGLSDDDAHYLAKTLGCTPEYASPELLSGQDSVDARSDIYSVGKIIRLMFPHRYSLIWHKCTRLNPRRRFPSADAIVHAMGTCRAANILAIVLTLLGIAAGIVVPPISRMLEYSSEVAAAEQSFEKGCTQAEVPADRVPQISMSSYFSISEARAERKDSLNAIFSGELRERIVRRDAIRALDSLFNAYKEQISQEPYKDFGLHDAARFYQESKKLCDERLSLLSNDDNWHSFYSYTEKRRKDDFSAIVNIARTLPDYSGLPPEEVSFYKSLTKADQPYRPYVK